MKLPAGRERVHELCRWLFLRQIKTKKITWDDIKSRMLNDNDHHITFDWINDTLTKDLKEEYGFEFTASKIRSASKDGKLGKETVESLQALIRAVDRIPDAHNVSGDAFEYLLYQRGSDTKDFGTLKGYPLVLCRSYSAIRFILTC